MLAVTHDTDPLILNNWVSRTHPETFLCQVWWS